MMVTSFRFGTDFQTSTVTIANDTNSRYYLSQNCMHNVNPVKNGIQERNAVFVVTLLDPELACVAASGSPG